MLGQRCSIPCLISEMFTERAIWNGCELRFDYQDRSQENNLLYTDLLANSAPLDESIRDCVESLITIGGVKPSALQSFKKLSPNLLRST